MYNNLIRKTSSYEAAPPDNAARGVTARVHVATDAKKKIFVVHCNVYSHSRSKCVIVQLVHVSLAPTVDVLAHRRVVDTSVVCVSISTHNFPRVTCAHITRPRLTHSTPNGHERQAREHT